MMTPAERVAEARRNLADSIERAAGSLTDEDRDFIDAIEALVDAKVDAALEDRE